MPDDLFHDISPSRVLREIAAALPAQCREHVIIIGSLAAGHHYYGDEPGMQVRTKDADCLLAPRSIAVAQAREVTNDLLAHGWFRVLNEGLVPGTATTPPGRLPVIRLRPHPDHPWFIELLTSTNDEDGREFLPVETADGYYSLASFPYLSLTAYVASDFAGIKVAKPSMLALVNLLNHQVLTEATMSAPMGGRQLLRCSKDLGRVLAIAFLQLRRDPNEGVEPWTDEWIDGLRACHPLSASRLAQGAGNGLRALLESRDHLGEAHHSCIHGLHTAHELPERGIARCPRHGWPHPHARCH